MRGCARAAIALVALEACAPSGSAKRSASYLADLPDYCTACTTTRTPEAYENCRAAMWSSASVYDCDSSRVGHKGPRFAAEAAPDDCHVQINLAASKTFKRTMSDLYAVDKKFSCCYKL
jgi:hypothetical protein